MFNANSESSTQDSIVSEGTNIGAMAQQFYKKPIAMVGGGNNFINFDSTHVNGLGRLQNSSDATFAISGGNASSVLITGTPLAAYNYTWKVYTKVTAVSIRDSVG